MLISSTQRVRDLGPPLSTDQEDATRAMIPWLRHVLPMEHTA